MWYRLGLWFTAVVLAAAPAMFGRPSSALAFAFALCAICIIDALEVILSTGDEDWRKKVVMFVFPIVFFESLAIMYWSAAPLQQLNALLFTISATKMTIGLVGFSFTIAFVTRLIHAAR